MPTVIDERGVAHIHARHLASDVCKRRARKYLTAARFMRTHGGHNRRYRRALASAAHEIALALEWVQRERTGDYTLETD